MLHKTAEEWVKKGTVLDNLGKYENEWNNKGIDLNNLGKYRKAIKCFDKVVKFNPHNKNAWNNKGYALEKLGKSDEANKCFDKANKINPNNKNAKTNRRIAQKKLEKLEKQQLEEKKKKEVGEWFKDGYALFNLGKYEEAIKCYDKIIELNPKDEDAKINRKIAKEKLEKQQLEEKKKKEVREWLKDSNALTKLGKSDDANKCFDKSDELKPKYRFELTEIGKKRRDNPLSPRYN